MEPPSSGGILDQVAAQPIASWGALKDLSKVVRRAVQEWVVEERAERGLKADRVRPGVAVLFRVQQPATGSACLGVRGVSASRFGGGEVGEGGGQSLLAEAQGTLCGQSCLVPTCTCTCCMSQMLGEALPEALGGPVLEEDACQLHSV